jgi:hypothetical protein
VAFRVIRPLGGLVFTGAGTSPTVTPFANAITQYQVQLPIRQGDLIGFNCCTALGGDLFASPGASMLQWSGYLADSGPGRTAFVPTVNPWELLLNADIEPTATIGSIQTAAKKHGKLSVTVDLPNPGRLAAGDAQDATVSAVAAKKRLLLKPTVAQAAAPGPLTILVTPTKAARAALADRGKLKAQLKLVFTPTGGGPSSQTAKVKLKR